MLTIILCAIALIAGYLIGNKKTNLEDAQTDIVGVVNNAASDSVNKAVIALFKHYEEIIVKAPEDQAVEAAQVLTVKLEQLKMIQAKVETLNKVVKNVTAYE